LQATQLHSGKWEQTPRKAHRRKFIFRDDN
jgi:hypothetical protein